MTCDETPKSMYVLSESDTIKLHNITSNLLLDLTTIDNVNESSALFNHKGLLESKSRTANVWLQYMKYIEILKLFIRTEGQETGTLI